MLHTNFQSHRPFGSEEDFLRFLPYMGMVAILVMWPGPLNKFLFPHPMEAPYEIWQTTEAHLSYKHTREPSAQVS